MNSWLVFGGGVATGVVVGAAVGFGVFVWLMRDMWPV